VLFSTPLAALLVAAGAAAVPIIIHLLNRKRFRVVPWAAMRFLLAAQKRNIRRMRIEQLLLSGLDSYFSGKYNRAINLWTRVLFLDRHHDRARAYIDRARNAEAEQQREAEALLHEGLQAFDDGKIDQARRLLNTALDRGASSDLALGVLNRIERLAVAQGRHARDTDDRREVPPVVRSRHASPRVRPSDGTQMVSTLWLVVVIVVAMMAAGAWVFSLDDLTTWARWPGSPLSDLPPSATTTLLEPLPVPGTADVLLRRAQAHFAAGRVRDALAVLDQVPVGNPRHADAERLRGLIQRELLAAADAVIPPPDSRHDE
jgi:tetratricopeptide (TPR) repeat protein